MTTHKNSGNKASDKKYTVKSEGTEKKTYMLEL
jgi:hypothetical protein